MKKIKLKLLERILILPLLPETGSFDKIIIKKDVVKKIGFTQAELTEFDIKESDGRVSWNKEGAEKVFEIKLTELEFNYVKSVFTKLNSEEKLTEQMIDIYKQFN